MDESRLALKSLYKFLRSFNNVLLIPMFTVLVFEAGTGAFGDIVDPDALDLFFCASFFLEWCLGLWYARDRRAFVKNPANIIDLLSSIPFGSAFHSFRLARLLRVVRLGRIILRARRYEGKGADIVRAIGVFGATTVAGGIALKLVEPETVPTVTDALWWAIVTMSTVGYGDITPTTPAGQIVAAALMVFGVGMFGYLAGFTASLIEKPEEGEALKELRALKREMADLRTLLEEKL